MNKQQGLVIRPFKRAHMNRDKASLLGVCVCVCVCVCSAYVRVCACTRVCLCAHICVRVDMHACMRACVHVRSPVCAGKCGARTVSTSPQQTPCTPCLLHHHVTIHLTVNPVLL
jgi:hypothetical protein